MRTREPCQTLNIFQARVISWKTRETTFLGLILLALTTVRRYALEYMIYMACPLAMGRVRPHTPIIGVTKLRALMLVTARPYMSYTLTTATLMWSTLKSEMKRPHALTTTTVIACVFGMVPSMSYVPVTAATLPHTLATSKAMLYAPYMLVTGTISKLARKPGIQRPCMLPATMTAAPSTPPTTYPPTYPIGLPTP